jgi:hypothetical protein
MHFITGFKLTNIKVVV